MAKRKKETNNALLRASLLRALSFGKNNLIISCQIENDKVLIESQEAYYKTDIDTKLNATRVKDLDVDSIIAFLEVNPKKEINLKKKNDKLVITDGDMTCQIKEGDFIIHSEEIFSNKVSYEHIKVDDVLLKLFSHAKKICPDDKNQVQLFNIRFKDNAVVASDGCMLLRYRTKGTLSENCILFPHPLVNELTSKYGPGFDLYLGQYDGRKFLKYCDTEVAIQRTPNEYPEVERVFKWCDDNEVKSIFTIATKKMKEFIKAYIKIGKVKKINYATFDLRAEDGRLIAGVDDLDDIQLLQEVGTATNDFKISFCRDRFSELLNYSDEIKAYVYDFNKVAKVEITKNLDGLIAPCVSSDEEE